MFEELVELALTLGITLPQNAPMLFARYAEILLEENKRMNLTRITEQREIMIKHLLDSLALLARLPTPATPILDMGSGAGLPGIPLKIARPDLSITLIDALQKRVDFLQRTAAVMNMGDIHVYHGRAEDLARRSEFREKFPLVVSRAVARLHVLAELCLPFTAVGGIFVAYKGPEGGHELEEAQKALHELGCSHSEVWTYALPEGMGERTLILISKQESISEKYPRKAGVPAKKPLI